MQQLLFAKARGRRLFSIIYFHLLSANVLSSSGYILSVSTWQYFLGVAWFSSGFVAILCADWNRFYLLDATKICIKGSRGLDNQFEGDS